MRYILVTSGDPSGIGPDICLDLASSNIASNSQLIILGDINLLRLRAKLLNKNIELHATTKEELINLTKQNKLLPKLSNSLWVLDIHCPNINCAGVVDYNNVNYVFEILDTAIYLCKIGVSKAIVTAPVSKEALSYKEPFSGHTEYFAKEFGCKDVVMMLVNQGMRVALLTTHLPLNMVATRITKQLLSNSLDIILSSFKDIYKLDNPRIAVCGLNPHAGENGYLGNEEIAIINPVIKSYQQRGYNISGSHPADTVFLHYQDFDVILAMYHDQGLPVLKFLGLDTGINISLGLPIIRVSVDHGTAFALAGTNKASSLSLLEAVKFANKCD